MAFVTEMVTNILHAASMYCMLLYVIFIIKHSKCILVSDEQNAQVNSQYVFSLFELLKSALWNIIKKVLLHALINTIQSMFPIFRSIINKNGIFAFWPH